MYEYTATAVSCFVVSFSHLILAQKLLAFLELPRIVWVSILVPIHRSTPTLFDVRKAVVLSQPPRYRLCVKGYVPRLARQAYRQAKQIGSV